MTDTLFDHYFRNPKSSMTAKYVITAKSFTKSHSRIFVKVVLRANQLNSTKKAQLTWCVYQKANTMTTHQAGHLGCSWQSFTMASSAFRGRRNTSTALAHLLAPLQMFDIPRGSLLGIVLTLVSLQKKLATTNFHYCLYSTRINKLSRPNQPCQLPDTSLFLYVSQAPQT